MEAATKAGFDAAVERASEWLAAGETVALPTETVYGLAANACNETAVRRIYEVKGRPSHNPIIVHVADVAMARACVAEWPGEAAKLARAFWPGPLTLVLPRSARIPDIVTAGGPTVGIRWPAHPLIQAVIRRCGFPLAAPSANRSTGLSPTTAEHVFRGLSGRVPLIIDGGPCSVGIESTVVDLTAQPVRVLRPGVVSAAALESVIGVAPSRGGEEPGVPRSPGLLDRHYAPRAHLRVLRWRDAADLARQLGSVDPGTVCVMAHTAVPGLGRYLRVSVVPRDAEAFARALYAELHQCDELGAHWIVVEDPPEGTEWLAVADRLRRASVASGPESGPANR